jgi:hypothetical protein
MTRQRRRSRLHGAHEKRARNRPSNIYSSIPLIFIAAFFALDNFVLRLDAPLFLARKFYDLLGWIPVWR